MAETVVLTPVSINGFAKPAPASKPRSKPLDKWFYPEELEHDLDGIDLPVEAKKEIMACGWEYTRCIIPDFKNWDRYLAFVRLMIMATIVEYRGDKIDVLTGDETNFLGVYDVAHILDILFGSVPFVREAMAREWRTFVLITGDKTSDRRDSELFRRYVNALASGPRNYFRIRDTDALARFSMAAAIAANDALDEETWPSEAEWEIIAELGCSQYDTTAFYKHRTEGETNNAYAYAGPEARPSVYRRSREVTWALDALWTRDSAAKRVLVNFIRPFGGPIHMMMRRYRYIEDGLIIGKPESETEVSQTRKNFKLWNRLDNSARNAAHQKRYEEAMRQKDHILIDGLAELLEAGGKGHCDDCVFRDTYGAEVVGEFGGVKTCAKCREEWQSYMDSLPSRAAKVFPELVAHWPAENGVHA